MRRRRRRRQVPWYRKKHSALSLALKTARFVRHNLNVEKKTLDLTSSGTVSSTGSVFHVSGIPQGDGQNARDGVSVRCQYLGLRMEYTENASVAGATFLRLMILRDGRQIASATPAIGTILETVDRNSFLNNDTLGRFQILHDRIYTLSNVGTVGKHISVDLPMSSHIRYNGTLSSNIESNGLYVVLISNQGTNVPSVGFTTRIRYVDN